MGQVAEEPFTDGLKEIPPRGYENPDKKQYVTLEDARIAQYLRVETDLTLLDIRDAKKILLEKRFEEANILQQLWGMIYWGLKYEAGKLAIKDMVKLITNIDQLAKYIPNSFAQQIIMWIDKFAEGIYKQMKD